MVTAPVFVDVPAFPRPVMYHGGGSGTAALILPGMGEPRTGINYLWSELARALSEHEVSCLRPELSGCGNAPGSKSARMWRQQTAAAVDHLRQSATRVVVIARGSSALVVPASVGPQDQIALRPAGRAALGRLLDANGSRPCFTPARLVRDGFHPDVEDLGVESRCAGGFDCPTETLTELHEYAAQFCAPSHIWFTDAPTYLTLAQRAELIDRMVRLCAPARTREGVRHVERG